MDQEIPAEKTSIDIYDTMTEIFLLMNTGGEIPSVN